MDLDKTSDRITIGIFNGKDTLCVVYRLPNPHTPDEMETCIDDIKTRYISGERSTPREKTEIECAEHEEIKQILKRQRLPFNEIPVLRSIFKAERDECFSAIYCYMYGVINGKRMERTRRKKSGAAL